MLGREEMRKRKRKRCGGGEGTAGVCSSWGNEIKSPEKYVLPLASQVLAGKLEQWDAGGFTIIRML